MKECTASGQGDIKECVTACCTANLFKAAYTTSERCSFFLTKIADFGMARDLMDEAYYQSSGGKIPVKWTAPEVGKISFGDV